MRKTRPAIVVTLALAGVACAKDPVSKVDPGTKAVFAEPPAAAAATSATGPAMLADPSSESIGGVRVGDRAKRVVAAFGPPSTKSKVIVWEATGDRVSTWSWDGEGLSIDMAASAGDFVVHSISLQSPGAATTSRGIGIGASFEDVDRAYREFRGVGLSGDQGETEQWDRNRIIVGSIYGGTFFDFEGGAVVRIFVGAGAE